MNKVVQKIVHVALIIVVINKLLIKLQICVMNIVHIIAHLELCIVQKNVNLHINMKTIKQLENNVLHNVTKLINNLHKI